MKKSKILVLVLISIFTLVSLAGCGGKETPKESEAPPPAVTKVSLATGGTAGTYYPIGAAITSIITKHVPHVEATAEATGASVANLKMIAEKQVDFIMGAANTTLSAFKGEEPFEKPIDNIRGIAALYPETFQFVVLKNSKLVNIPDLKGKRVVVGAPGSGTERTVKLLLEAYEIDYTDIKPQFLSFAEGVTALKDRLADCAIVGAGTPTAAVVDASTTLDIGMLNVDPAVFSKIADKNPDLTVVIIPAGTYKGVEEDITTVASPALLSTHQDMDAELVYEITKAIFENIEVVQEAHAQGKSVTLESALQGMSVPLHPGAEKYYQEKGIIK